MKPLPERLYQRVHKTDTCWLWTGKKTTGGYGLLWMGDGRHAMAHRLMYELEVGPIPSDLVLDHLCRVTLCVRPDHLEIVSRAENSMRGEAPGVVTFRTNVCKRGHEITEENTRLDPRGNGRKQCRACWLQAMRDWRVRQLR